jgi:hypothetical protein
MAPVKILMRIIEPQQSSLIVGPRVVRGHVCVLLRPVTAAAAVAAAALAAAAITTTAAAAAVIQVAAAATAVDGRAA